MLKISKTKDYLLKWMEEYMKHRDILTKKIITIKKDVDNFDLVIESKDKKHNFCILPTIENINCITNINDKDTYVSIVTLSNKKNANFVIRNWELLCEYKRLSIYFVNPFSKTDKKWIIYPYIHNKICEPESLEQGIMALLEGVETIEEDFLKKILED